MKTPEGFDVQPCRSCGRPVVWAATKNDKLMPVDAEPTADGNVELAVGALGRGVVATVLTGPSLMSTPLRTSHFATCPQADEWRSR